MAGDGPARPMGCRAAGRHAWRRGQTPVREHQLGGEGKTAAVARCVRVPRQGSVRKCIGPEKTTHGGWQRGCQQGPARPALAKLPRGCVPSREPHCDGVCRSAWDQCRPLEGAQCARVRQSPPSTGQGVSGRWSTMRLACACRASTMASSCVRCAASRPATSSRLMAATRG